MSKLVGNTAIVTALIGAIVGVLAAAGVDVEPELKDALVGLALAVLGFVGLYVHPSVPIGPQPPG